MNFKETQQNPIGLYLRLRHKWFSHYDQLADDGWWGPFDTVHEAALECYAGNSHERIFIAQGYKTSRKERAEGFPDWEVSTEQAFEIVLPTK
jgi:hypothetical protein